MSITSKLDATATMPTTIVPVVLCGGSGTRLWPLSRSGFPKQFLSLTGNDSLFQLTLQRLNQLASSTINVAAPIVVCNETHRYLALEQLRETKVPVGQFLLEPCGRNTAPALTLAALAAQMNGQDPVLVVAPSDQTITDLPSYNLALQRAVTQAAGGDIVILGITPSRPETGYGYIEADVLTDGVAKVLNFVEKPDRAKAEFYVQSKSYFWNGGMFVLRASQWLKALATFRPQLAAATEQSFAQRQVDDVFIRPERRSFEQLQGESIDYAVMEQCPDSEFSLKMVVLDAGWNDLGAWDAVWDVADKDAAGNSLTGDVINIDSENTLVHATSRLVGLVGVNNLVVVETADAVLVADKSSGQSVKEVVNILSHQQREEMALHRKVHRPWGWYDTIDSCARFKVKRILVNPKASLSLQKHHHRSEHWVVVKGTAEIQVGDKSLVLTENQSTYIPLGEIHRLSNPGCIPLEIIEVQSGSYLGEDDIVRFEDHYGR